MENSLDSTFLQRPTEKWEDFNDNDHVKRELTFYATFHNKFPTNGLLIFGPPAVGKTKLTRGLANHFPQLTFVSISGTNIKREKIGSVFSLAKKHQPSILFIEDSELVIPHEVEDDSQKAQSSCKEDFIRELDLNKITSANVLIIIESNEPWKLDRTVLKTFFSVDIHVLAFSTADRKRLLMSELINSKRFGDQVTSEHLTYSLMKNVDGFSKQQMIAAITEAIVERAKRYFSAARCTHVKQFKTKIKKYTYEWVPCCPDTEGAVNIYTDNSEQPNIDHEKVFIPPDFLMTILDLLSGFKTIKDKGGVLQPAVIAKYFAFQKWLYKDWLFATRNHTDEKFYEGLEDQEAFSILKIP